MFRMTKDLSPEELPKALVKNALDNGSGDNITAAVMK